MTLQHLVTSTKYERITPSETISTSISLNSPIIMNNTHSLVIHVNITSAFVMVSSTTPTAGMII